MKVVARESGVRMEERARVKKNVGKKNRNERECE